MTRRDGASLLNVMVFVMFAAMIASQVFFFAKASVDSVAEDREIMMYRLMLGSLVDAAKSAVKGFDSIDADNPPGATYATFYDNTKTGWSYPGLTDPYHASIHSLHYTLSTVFDRTTFTSQSRDQRIFAAMPPLSFDKTTKTLSTDGITSIDQTVRVITNSFYLIRAWATLPENYYGATLMYQVLVSKDERSATRQPDTLSFQEVWY